MTAVSIPHEMAGDGVVLSLNTVDIPWNACLLPHCCTVPARVYLQRACVPSTWPEENQRVCASGAATRRFHSTRMAAYKRRTSAFRGQPVLDVCNDATAARTFCAQFQRLVPLTTALNGSCALLVGERGWLERCVLRARTVLTRRGAYNVAAALRHG